MRISRIFISRAAFALAGAALLGACSGTGDATRSLTPSARSNDAFVATMPPTVMVMTPQNGPTAGGNTITISGTQFDGSTRVAFGSQAVQNLSVVSSTTVTFPAPQGQGAMVPVVLSTNQGAAVPQIFRYDPPALISLTPTAGPSAGGTPVTLSGINFGVNPVVMFGNSVATIASHTHTQIVVNAPAGEPGQSSQVRVTAGDQSSPTGAAYTYSYLPPTIADIVPNHGPTSGGNAVTLVGQSFGSATPTVTVNGVNAQVMTPTQSSIVFMAPAGEGKSRQVVVTAAGFQSNAVSYDYDPPVVTNISPSSGPTSGGTPVTISGVNFGLTATVTIGGVTAPVTTRSHTTIVATTPAGVAGNAPVVVTVLGQSSNGALPFTYIAPVPTITNIAPATGPTAGGSVITVIGSNFGTSPTVTMGGASVGGVTSTNTQLTFTLPAGEGTTPVVVSTAGGPSNAFPFTYGAPTIAAIAPNSGPSAGGYPVTLTGSNFGLNPTVTVDGASANLALHTHTQIVFTAPAGQPGHDAAVRVSAAGQASTNSATFHYNTPTLASITPSHGSTSGGNTITLTGANFGTSPVVLFGSTTALPTSISQTQITAIVPAGQGSAAVSVRSGTVVSGALTYDYDAPTIASITPATGPVAGGTYVTITGTSFGLTPTVMFGGTAGVMGAGTMTSHTRIVVMAPAGAPGTVPLIVTVAGKTSNAMSYQYGCPDGTVISNGVCVTPVAALGNVVASLPTEAQAQLAPIVTEITTKLADDNPHNDNGACGQLNALSKQTAALLKSGKISASQSAAVQSSITLVSAKAGCK